MRSQLCFTQMWKGKKSEKGFFLPYVLFITSLVLIIVTASAHAYHREIQITHHQIEHIRLETLLQMGLASFKEEHIPNDLSHFTVDYLFPDGEVTITYLLIDDFGYQLRFNILTVNQSVYRIIHPVETGE